MQELTLCDFVMCEQHRRTTCNPFFVGVNIGLKFVKISQCDQTINELL